MHAFGWRLQATPILSGGCEPLQNSPILAVEAPFHRGPWTIPFQRAQLHAFLQAGEPNCMHSCRRGIAGRPAFLPLSGIHACTFLVPLAPPAIRGA